MPYVVRLAAEVARQHNWRGTRRRVCTLADGSRELVVFGREPVIFAVLPPEVAEDPMLLVTEEPASSPDVPPQPWPAAEPAPEPPAERPPARKIPKRHRRG